MYLQCVKLYGDSRLTQYTPDRNVGGGGSDGDAYIVYTTFLEKEEKKDPHCLFSCMLLPAAITILLLDTHSHIHIHTV